MAAGRVHQSSMSRQTPTSRRSPSILVTDVRHQKAHSAPFVSRSLNSVSIDSLLSNTSEVPSAQRRAAPRRFPNRDASSITSHRSRMAGGSRRDDKDLSIAARSAIETSERTPLIDASTSTNEGHKATENEAYTSSSSSNRGSSASSTSARSTSARLASNGKPIPTPGGVKPIPRLSKPLPSRQSKQGQRLVLIPDSTSSREEDTTNPTSSGSNTDDGDSQRVTSYLISEGILLHKAAAYLKSRHRARVRLYGEALFADYLLPILPGNGVDYRIRSSLGDNRTMERMIDISEQGDHHFEYFSAETSTGEQDPSEPHDFSPRPGHGVLSRERHDSTQDNSLKGAEMHSSGGTSGIQSSSSIDDSNGNSHHKLDGEDISPSPSSSGSTGSGSSSDPNTGPESSHHRHPTPQEQVETHRRLQSYMSHAEMFLFNYGVVVFWNFTEAQEKQVLADLCIGNEDLVVNPVSDVDIQSEELKFKYTQDPDVKPRVFNDMITLNSNSHMLKLAMSHAMAQSTILCCFEDQMQIHLNDVSGVPKRLALTGKLGMNREQLLKISGRLFKLRVDINLSSNVLEVPEFFWDSEPSLFPLFNALREYLEIDERVLVLNERQSVFLELTSILSDSIAEFNMDRITIIVIWLIVLSICVSLTEIGVRFLLLSHQGSE